MAFGEVFTSLQTGVIDAQENPLALIKSASFFEVQKYVNRTEHVRSWIYLAISEKTFNKLNAEQKKAVQEAAQRAQAYERTLMLADEKKLESELKAKGMIFVVLIPTRPALPRRRKKRYWPPPRMKSSQSSRSCMPTKP
ncbi:MAG: hypothetical protein RLZZ371_741, partial [Pseudomonadota bacterium]